MRDKVENRLVEFVEREARLELLLIRGENTEVEMKDLKRQLLDVRVRRRNLARNTRRQKTGLSENRSQNVKVSKLVDMEPNDKAREDINNNLLHTPPGEPKLHILPVPFGILSKSENTEIFQGRRIISHKDIVQKSGVSSPEVPNIVRLLPAEAADLSPSVAVKQCSEKSDSPTSTRPKLKWSGMNYSRAELGVTKVSTIETPNSSCGAEVLVKSDNFGTSSDIMKENPAETDVLTSIRPKLRRNRFTGQCPDLLTPSNSINISKTVTVVQPSGLVRLLLGSGGAGREIIEKESDTRIIVTGRFGDEKRNIKIIGTKEAIAKAECLMMKHDTVSLTRNEAGVMLRNGGKIVKGIENESDTMITIEGGKKDSKRIASISGTEEAKRKARALIVAALSGI